MSGHDIIVIGASAGGIEALNRLLGTLPGSLPASLFVVLHIPAQATSSLPAILSRAGPLPAFHALDGAKIQPGQIYVAPPDHHLLIEADGTMRVSRGPKENRHRPAVDPLFRSAALAYGRRVIGVILSGSLDDGTAGLLAIKRQGGTAIVQEPKEALYPSMPLSALHNVEVDYCLPLAEIGSTLVRLANEPLSQEEVFPVPEDMEREHQLIKMNPAVFHSDERTGHPSPFSCPECGGVMWEVQEGDLLRFRCRVGHALSAKTMLANQSQALEEALWTALKTLEESAELMNRLAEQARQLQQSWLETRYHDRAAASLAKAETIRQVLLKTDNISANLDQDYQTDSHAAASA